MSDRVYKALLIANWDFPHDPDQLPPLNGPQEDVRQLREVLTSRRTGLHDEGNVKILPDRTRGEILRRIEDFFLDATRDDQLLLYYSGHGKLSLFDELYLCARDTRADRLVSSAVGTSAISTIVDASPAAAKILVLDCCYSGSFKGGDTLPGKLAGEGRFVLTASRGAELAPDAEAHETTSPFTRFLIEALAAEAEDSDGDGYLSVEDVYAYVADRMRRDRLSRPQRSFASAVDVIALARAPSDARPTAVFRPDPPLRTSVAVSLSPSAAREAVQQGLAAQRSGQLWAARAAYEQAAHGGVGDWSELAASLLGAFLQADGDLTAAKAAYQQVARSGHRDWAPRAAVQLGELHLATRTHSEAEKAFRQALDSGHPQWAPAAANYLADLLAERGETAAARYLYDQAIHSGHLEWAPRAYIKLGALLVADGKVGAAKAAYRRAASSGSERWASEAATGLSEL
jgi:tetratricopeptide (TPR) repeat protein